MLPGAYERFYELLRDALITGGPPPVNPADSVATLRVIEAAQQSVQESKIVEL
jgi:predicted dehydrogenase